MKSPLRIGATGYCAVDYLYEHVDFSSPFLTRLLSSRPNDGGLIEGGLVFTSDLEKYVHLPFSRIREEILGKSRPDVTNIGGPALVSAIQTSQLLEKGDFSVTYYGCNGGDQIHRDLTELLSHFRLSTKLTIHEKETSPYTLVLCDPKANGGEGERSFVVNMGALEAYGPQEIPPEFFTSDICLFGGTALVPLLHDSLASILKATKEKGALNVVGTVFDYRSERRGGEKQPWPLGEKNGRSYPLIDLLVTDRLEALRLTLARSTEEAVRQFAKWGVKACMVTDGANPTAVWASSGGIWKARELAFLPVSSYVSNLHGSFDGDTTGCGDNFLGGATASLALQRNAGRERLDIDAAYRMAAAGGAFACTYHGGAYREKEEGEKRRIVEGIMESDSSVMRMN